MIIWLDAHLSHFLAEWLKYKFKIDAKHLRELSLRDASDIEIFDAAKKENAIIITKDADFSYLLAHKGAPPKVIWLRMGNTSNKYLQQIFQNSLQKQNRPRVPKFETVLNVPDYI